VVTIKIILDKITKITKIFLIAMKIQKAKKQKIKCLNLNLLKDKKLKSHKIWKSLKTSLINSKFIINTDIHLCFKI